MHTRDAYDLAPHNMDDRVAVAQYRDADFRPWPAAHVTDRVVNIAFFNRYTVDRNDLVAAAHAGTRGGRTGDWRDDSDDAVNLTNFNTDTRVTARRADADIAIFFSIEILGVRVEIADHAANGAFEKPVIIDGLDVVPLYARHDLSEQARLLPGHFIGIGLARLWQ